jgi:hypothetical protein
MSDSNNEAFEREKLKIEHQKLELEFRKARWTSLSIGVPVMAAIITAAFGFWSTYQTAKLQFKLKAAESVMQAPNPANAVGRAQFLMELFPGELTKFARDADPEKYTGDTDPQVKIELLKLFAGKTDSAADILAVWQALFPGDSWAKDAELAKTVAPLRLSRSHNPPGN